MSRININKNKYDFLEKNLKIYKNKNIISNKQYDEITSLYNVKSVNTIQVFTILGSILIGLGVIVYLASNWRNLDNLFKLGLIISAYIFSNFVAYKTSVKYKKTSRSILYLGVIMYGAGVMLTQNIFNYNMEFVPTGLLWLLGILPTIYLFEEKAMYVFSCILLLMFSMPYLNTYPYTIILVYLLIFILGQIKFIDFNIGIFLRNMALYALIAQYLNLFKVKDIYIFLIIVLIGVVLIYFKFKYKKSIHEIEGLILVAIFGLNLSFSEIWGYILDENISIVLGYIFGLSYFIYFMYETTKGKIICIAPVIVLVIRYFSDSLLLAVPKSLLFIVVGGLLLGTGFYIEQSINKKGK